ncbi:unnamed protein product [Thlaspi arvense]|uniref:G-patch domain-containing protein n=1 Tax=Thlaspi arvense TaxID=13288 RepID=A0AAU9RRG2_THLAR|nr:unnamed protein product [Thlaspi arvense]
MWKARNSIQPSLSLACQAEDSCTAKKQLAVLPMEKGKLLAYLLTMVHSWRGSNSYNKRRTLCQNNLNQAQLTSFEPKVNSSRKTTPVASGGKLAFSLKQKSKLVAPSIKLSEDEEEEEKDAGNALGNGLAKRQKVGEPVASEQSSKQADVAYYLCSYQQWWKEMFNERFGKCGTPDTRLPTYLAIEWGPVRSCCSLLGIMNDSVDSNEVAIVRFLFDESCADYKYYEYRLAEEERALSQTKDLQPSQSGNVPPTTATTASGSQRSFQHHSSYQTPASALYESSEDSKDFMTAQHSSAGRSDLEQEIGVASKQAMIGESSGPSGGDPIAMMEFYMKKAAQEERRRQPKHSKDEMPPPASLQGPMKKGHHMGDFIPPEELEKFMASCNDAAAQKAAKDAADRAKIQSDNVGHRLLSKMGWREGDFFVKAECQDDSFADFNYVAGVCPRKLLHENCVKVWELQKWYFGSNCSRQCENEQLGGWCSAARREQSSQSVLLRNPLMQMQLSADGSLPLAMPSV